MVRIKVLKPFYDLKRHADVKAGDEYDVTEERAAHLDAVLPGYITYAQAAEPEPETAPEPKPDYAAMTYTELNALAKERGIQLKGRPKKAQLIEALSEE